MACEQTTSDFFASSLEIVSWDYLQIGMSRRALFCVRLMSLPACYAQANKTSFLVPFLQAIASPSIRLAAALFKLFSCPAPGTTAEQSLESGTAEGHSLGPLVRQVLPLDAARPCPAHLSLLHTLFPVASCGATSAGIGQGSLSSPACRCPCHFSAFIFKPFPFRSCFTLQLLLNEIAFPLSILSLCAEQHCMWSMAPSPELNVGGTSQPPMTRSLPLPGQQARNFRSVALASCPRIFNALPSGTKPPRTKIYPTLTSPNICWHCLSFDPAFL